MGCEKNWSVMIGLPRLMGASVSENCTEAVALQEQFFYFCKIWCQSGVLYVQRSVLKDTEHCSEQQTFNPCKSSGVTLR